MKQPITKFDLESAFKALDDIKMPEIKTNSRVKANRPLLKEAVRKTPNTDALLEEYYDVNNTEDLNDAQEERDTEVAKAKLARIEKIVDLDANSADELLPSYVGKVIIQCPQCMTLFYKNPEDIEASEDDETVVNISETCQHCGNTSGYTVIGKVDGISEEEAANYEEAETAETEAETDGETEDVSNIDLGLGSDADETEETADEDTENADETEVDDEDKKEESFKVSGTPLTESTGADDDRPKVIANMFNNLSEDTWLTEALYDVSDEEWEELLNSQEFQDPIHEDMLLAGADAEDCEDCMAKTIEEAIEDVEDIDEETIENKLTESLKNVYENVKSFTLTECSLNEGALAVTGNITFNSGKTKKTSYTFTEAKSNALIGSNKGLSDNGNFNIYYKVANKKLFTESVSYRYSIGKNLVEGKTTLTEAPKWVKNAAKKISSVKDSVANAFKSDSKKMEELLNYCTNKNFTVKVYKKKPTTNRNGVLDYAGAKIDDSLTSDFADKKSADTYATAQSKLTKGIVTISITTSANKTYVVFEYANGKITADNTNKALSELATNAKANSVRDAETARRQKEQDDAQAEEEAKKKAAEQANQEKERQEKEAEAEKEQAENAALTIDDIKKSSYSDDGKFIITHSKAPSIDFKTLETKSGDSVTKIVFNGLDNALAALDTVKDLSSIYNFSLKYIKEEGATDYEGVLLQLKQGKETKNFRDYLKAYPAKVDNTEASSEPAEEAEDEEAEV